MYDNFVKSNKETSNLLIPMRENLQINMFSEATR